MLRFRVIPIVLATAQLAGAHLGNENDTEVRIYSDSMRVVLRTSIPFAWNILGAIAPPLADEAGKETVRPLLAATAPDLITITVGGKPIEPTSTDCLFEVPDDVAFILNFKRPEKWPTVIEAKFFDRLTPLDSGTIAIFDYTASRFSRDLKPIAKWVIDQRNPTLSFSLESVIATTPVLEIFPPPTVAGSNRLFRTIAAISLLLTATAVIGFLAYRRLRENL